MLRLKREYAGVYTIMLRPNQVLPSACFADNVNFTGTAGRVPYLCILPYAKRVVKMAIDRNLQKVVVH